VSPTKASFLNCRSLSHGGLEHCAVDQNIALVNTIVGVLRFVLDVCRSVGPLGRGYICLVNL